jgi:hypothetical protein
MLFKDIFPIYTEKHNKHMHKKYSVTDCIKPSVTYIYQ